MMGFHPVSLGLPIGLGLCVLELGRGTRQTDRQTDTGHHFIMPAPYGGRRHNKRETKRNHNWTVPTESVKQPRTWSVSSCSTPNHISFERSKHRANSQLIRRASDHGETARTREESGRNLRGREMIRSRWAPPRSELCRKSLGGLGARNPRRSRPVSRTTRIETSFDD